MKTIPWNPVDHIRTEEEATAYLEAWVELGADAGSLSDTAGLIFRAGYAAAREQAARTADGFDQRDTYACGAIASAIRAMTPEKDPAP